MYVNKLHEQEWAFSVVRLCSVLLPSVFFSSSLKISVMLFKSKHKKKWSYGNDTEPLKPWADFSQP